MKSSAQKTREKDQDDSLFGLLSAYKSFNTYIRILVNDEKKQVIFQMTDNPRHFQKPDEPEGSGSFRILKRSEMNITKLSIKYLAPSHILDFLGDSMGLRLTQRSIKVVNQLNGSERCYRLEVRVSQLQGLIQSVRKIVTLTPPKKYEIIEKYIANTTRPDVQE
jgi:hypothetical protein